MTTKKQKCGPKPGPNGKRVHLWGHGPRVDPATKLELDLWRDCYGVPYGRAIDWLLKHARTHPGFRIPTKGRKTYRQVPKVEPIPAPQSVSEVQIHTSTPESGQNA